MFDINRLQDCWAGLVGFVNNGRQHGLVDKSLSQSSTGIYADNRMHTLLTAENIMSIVEQRSEADAIQYDQNATYARGQVVIMPGNLSGERKYYRSLQDNNVNHSPTEENSEWWAATNAVSMYLREVYEGSVIELANRVAMEKKLADAGKTLLKDVVLYEGVGNIRNRVIKRNRFVGLKFNLRQQDIEGVLSKIGLQLSDAQNIDLYLYHSSQTEPVAVIPIIHTKSVQFEWHTVTQQLLPFLGNNTNAGGSWYLGYYEEELTGEAIDKDVNWTGVYGCNACNQANASLYRLWSPYFQVQPFYVEEHELYDDKSLWDEEKEFITHDQTFGLNVQMAIRCDVTRLFCANAGVVGFALGAMIKVKLLEAMAYSMRDNQKRERLSQLAAIALHDPEQKGVGATFDLSRAIKALTIDFSNVGSYCLPCDNRRHRVNMGSVYG